MDAVYHFPALSIEISPNLQLTFHGTNRPYPAYSQPIAIRPISAGSFRAHGNERATTSFAVERPHGNKPLQPFAGDCAGRSHGRPCAACGSELRQEARFQQPDDGVWWREVRGGLEAVKVLPDSPGQRAGIQEHDLLTGAEVLRDTPAQRTGSMQPQDLLPGDKPLARTPPSILQSSQKNPPPWPPSRICPIWSVFFTARDLRESQLRHPPAPESRWILRSLSSPNPWTEAWHRHSAPSG